MFQLAQINIARLLEPIDSPLLADFVADLDRINGIAEQSTGFVWRLKDENSNNATSINPFNDDSIIVNISVWESAEALKQFVYKSGHIEVYLKRAKWFERMDKAHMALWWVKKGKMPTAEESRDRLIYLQTYGETAHAFSFRHIFEPPAA
jgi:hypothetical protein